MGSSSATAGGLIRASPVEYNGAGLISSGRRGRGGVTSPRRFAVKTRNGMDHGFTFLMVQGVEPTNNREERALREHVVQRRIMGCFRNEKGTGIYETVLASWKQRGRDLSKTLGETFAQEWIKS